jgi:membrane protease YdiL (CAAX protease family)
MSFLLAKALPAPPARKGRPLLAWAVILGVIGFLLARSRPGPGGESEHYDPGVMEVQARYLVGVGEKFGDRKVLYPQAEAFNQGPYGQRLRFVVLAGELAGREEALTQLEKLKEGAADGSGPVPSPGQERLTGLLARVYAPPGRRGPLLPAEREELRERLGWFGELALVPPGDADPDERQRVLASAARTANGILGFAGGLVCLGVQGVGLGLLLLIFWLRGRLRGGLKTGSGTGGVYAETFAWYLVVFFGGSYLLGRLPVPEEFRPLVLALAAVGSLAVLAWPVLRGVPWAQVRAEIGWTAGRRPGLEPLVGVGCYLVGLPLVVAGFVAYLLATAALHALGVPPEPPSHPVVDWVLHSGWGPRLQLILDACVLAPLVEETMFRGVLYRHLREASAGAGRVGSVIFSVAVASFVFAVIHPQGLLFVPVLMALATAFALAREWRGTLVPPMIAHGITNGMTMLLLLTAAG